MKKAMGLLMVLAMMSAGCASMDKAPKERNIHTADLVEVAGAAMAPLNGLASGSAEAQARQQAAVAAGLPLEVKSAKTGIAFRLIPAGSFTMGSSSNESERDDDEGPQHTVTLSEPFYCGKFEVTQEQWEQVMGSNPSNFKNVGKDAPVEMVSWNDCQEFLKKTLRVGRGTARHLSVADGGTVGICLPRRNDNPVLLWKQSGFLDGEL